MDTLIVRFILGLIVLFLAAILTYIIRQDKQQKRGLTLDVDQLPQRPIVPNEPPEKESPKSNNKKKKR